MVYRWKEGARISADAQAVGTELEQIQQATGGLLMPALVVEKARDRRSAMHSHFEWNDTAAAVKHRENQARELLRHIVVTVEVPESDPVTVRAFVNVRLRTDDATKPVYTDIRSAVADDDWRSQIVAEAVDEINEVRAKLKTYERLIDSFGPAQLRLGEVAQSLTNVAA